MATKLAFAMYQPVKGKSKEQEECRTDEQGIKNR